MENQLQILKEMIELVVDDPCSSVNFLHVNLEEQNTSIDCLTKKGESFKLSIEN